MHVRSQRFLRIIAAALVAVVANHVFAGTACAQQDGPLRRPALRDARGWMPDVAARLKQLSALRNTERHLATSSSQDEPPWWWLPCPPPDEGRP